MKRILSLVLVLVLVLGSMPLAFADDMTPGEYLKANGLLQGGTDGDLMEEKALTRAEMTKMVLTLKGVEEEAAAFELKPGFTDVEEGKWYAPYIAYAQVNDLVDGMGDGTFAPEATLTRAQAAAFLLKAVGKYEAWDTVLEDAETEGIVDADADADFVRGNAFDMMKDTLAVTPEGEDMSVGAKLEIADYVEEEEPEVTTVKVDSAVALNSKVVEVSLDEAAEAVDASIFTVKNDETMEVEKAELAAWDTDNETVLVTLAEDLEEGTLYTITSGDTSANFGGLAEDEDAVEISEVANSTDPYEFKIEFKEAVVLDTVKVEVESSIDGEELAVLDMAYDSRDTIVVTTAEQTDDLYDVTVTAVDDLAGNSIEDDLTADFIGYEVPDADLQLTDAEEDGYGKVKLTFSEKLDADELDVAFFTVTETVDEEEVAVTAVELDDDAEGDEEDKVVILTLADTTDDLYTVEVEDLTDKYGNELDSDNDSEDFVGAEKPTDDFGFGTTSDDVSLNVKGNTEIEVTFPNDMDEDLAEDVSNYSIVETIDGDELEVLSAELDDNVVTLTVAEMSDDLYEMTIENVKDIYGNEIDTDNDSDEFVGAEKEDAVGSIESISFVSGSEDQLKVEFDVALGDNATDVANYKVNEDIGYPTKVEMDDDDDDDKTVILTLPTTYEDTVYELTVTGLENIDGVVMDSDDEITEDFVGASTEETDEVSLKGAKAINKYVANVYFDMDVEDIEGLITGDDTDNTTLQSGALILTKDDETSYDLADVTEYVYVSDDSDKLLKVVVDKDDSFDFDGLDGYTLNLDVDTDVDDADKSFVDSDDDPTDLEIKGVKSINSTTIEVIFNQDVQYVDNTLAEIQEEDDATTTIGLTNAVQSDVTDSRWIFSLASEMEDINYDFDVTDVDFAGTHSATVTTSELEIDDDALVTFSGDDTTEDYMDDVNVKNKNSKKFMVYYPEAMDETDVETTGNYTFFEDEDTETTISTVEVGYVSYDSDDNTATVYTLSAFDSDLDSVFVKFNTGIKNELGNKTIMDSDDEAIVKELVVDDDDADLVKVDDISTSGDVIEIELTHDISGATTTAAQLVDDFEVTLTDGTTDTTVTAGAISAVDYGDADSNEVQVTLNDGVIDGTDAIEVKAKDTENITSDWNGEYIEEDSSKVISTK